MFLRQFDCFKTSLEGSKPFSTMLYLTWAPGRDRFAVETVPVFGSLAVHGSYGSCLLAGFGGSVRGGSVRAVPVRFQNLPVMGLQPRNHKPLTPLQPKLTRFLLPPSPCLQLDKTA